MVRNYLLRSIPAADATDSAAKRGVADVSAPNNEPLNSTANGKNSLDKACLSLQIYNDRFWYIEKMSISKSDFKDIQKYSNAVITSIENNLHVICKLERKSLDNLASEKAKRASPSLKKKLAATPTSELSKYQKGIKHKALVASGLTTLEKLDKKSLKQLTSVNGLGSQSAHKIIASLKSFKADYISTFTMPLYEDLKKFDRALLESMEKLNTVSKLQIDKVGLQAEIDIVKKQREQLKTSTTWFKSIFLNRETTSRLIVEHGQLRSITEKLSQKTQVIAVGEIATRLTRRIPFLELKESYAISLADYSALYYKDCHAKLDSTGKPGVLGVPSSELVKAIESVSLCLEGLNVQLRGYQEFGIKYLIHQQLTVLGDEMGLGKTIQALGAMVHLQNTTNATHFLVVAPAGITPNWEKEIRARTHLTPWMLHGADKQRLLRQWQKMGGIALVSFSSLHTIANEANLTIHMVIGDEAHYVKNPSARRSKAFRSIAQSVEHVSLMSGTPMEIRPEEFIEVMKALGTDAKTGLSPATKPQQQLSAGPRKFAEAVSPVYLRRNQTDVLHELPEKIECAEWVNMSFEERSIYYQNVSSSHAMQIRQATTTAIRKSAKLNRIKELLAEYHDIKSKVVIFSYFHSCLDAICDETPNHYRIDGSVTAVQRQAIVDQF